MLLVYTHKVTPRFTYTMKQIFTRILGIEIAMTTTVEDFIRHTGPKITYTRQPLQNEFFVKSHDLLFEQGIRNIKVDVGDWEGTPCFFRTAIGSLPFDIFAASFFFLSRYEEYLPHEKDIHGRFPANQSITFREGFLQLPLIDIWAYKLLAALKEKFPELERKKRKYRYTSIIDVTSSHSFARRGLIRSTGGFLLDLFRFRIVRLFQRAAVLLNLRKDPYDNFDKLLALHSRVSGRCIFFFQFAQYSAHDKNVSPENNRFRYLIKSVADYVRVSLAASHSAHYDLEVLKTEKKRLSEVINRPLSQVRMRYNWIDIPDTYRQLVDAEFKEDYSMGYTHHMGFKANTCTPFFFYDIGMETQHPILIHPFAVHDYALREYKNEKEILSLLDELYNRVRKVDGHFITIFSNVHLGEKHKVDWIALYEKVITKYHA